jgi:putative cardiolipin synthase
MQQSAANCRNPIRMLAIICVMFLGACATVDFDAPKEEGFALQDTADTALGRRVAQNAANRPQGESGFYFLFDGVRALAARIAMANSAERSIDAQYYLITNDQIGLAFVRELLKAADRGVRVRLLLDDIQTKGYDVGMAALDSHPNMEIRIFNPWTSRSARFLDVFDFNRVNRRMHNKSFTADNQVTIVGGRNIADEYFSAREDVNFGDADVLGIGPVVNDVSTMFDEYWNSKYAAPVEVFAKMPKDPAAALVELRERLEANVEKIKQTTYGETLIADITDYLQEGSVAIDWAPYQLVYDSPDKANKKLAADAKNITTELGAVVEKAEQELIIVSPYFVPRKRGLEYFQGLIDRGLHIKVITNSLAANNHGIVHSGYMGSRKALLEMGVELHEMRVTAEVAGVERGGSGAELATLHTKAFMVDRQDIFFGSFNWDPRSANINTELGVVIESPELGAMIGERVDEGLAERTYQVILNDKGKIRWLDESGEEPVILDKEPDTTWWRRTKAQMGRILPVRGQL